MTLRWISTTIFYRYTKWNKMTRRLTISPNETYLSSLDLSDSDDDDDEDDDDELSCFRRGGFCMVECELFATLNGKVCNN